MQVQRVPAPFAPAGQLLQPARFKNGTAPACGTEGGAVSIAQTIRDVLQRAAERLQDPVKPLGHRLSVIRVAARAGHVERPTICVLSKTMDSIHTIGSAAASRRMSGNWAQCGRATPATTHLP